MNKDDFINKIWNYYLMIEDDFIETLKYVEPCEDNYNTYSKKYNSLLLSICSEIDNVIKILCKKVDSSGKYLNISNYRKTLKNYKAFSSHICLFKITNEEISPWLSWNSDKNPEWWIDYNKLKHHRLDKDNVKKGNYKNVLFALAGYYILCMVLYREYFDNEPFNKSSLFKMKKWRECLFIDEENVIAWSMPEEPDKFYEHVE